MAKKYYWLKLQRDFFKRHDITVIEGMPNGKDYILFYLKLLVESIDHEGELRFSDTIPYNASMLASVTNTNIDVVKSAMTVFQQLNMVEILPNETIYMNEVQKMIGSETDWAKKKRDYRGQLLDIPRTVEDNVRQEIEKEIDIDIDKKENIKRKKFIKPTIEELKAFINENNFSVDAEHFYDYYESNGWMIGKSPMKDWKATVRNWNRKNPVKKVDYDPFK